MGGNRTNETFPLAAPPKINSYGKTNMLFFHVQGREFGLAVFDRGRTSHPVMSPVSGPPGNGQ